MAAPVTARVPLVWQGTAVKGQDVLGAISRLSQEERLRAQDDVEIRSSVTNLIVHAVSPEDAERLERVVASLPDLRPSRTIILAEQAGPDQLDARVTVDALRSGNGPTIHVDRMVLEAHGQSNALLPSLVTALLLPDLPVVLYWPGRPPFGHPWLDAWTDTLDRLVVDTGEFTRARADLAGLRGVLGAGEIGAADLGWERLRPWREALASAFDPEERLGQLAHIDRIAIDLPATQDGQLVPGAHTAGLVLVGWLCATLGMAPSGPDAARPLAQAGRPVGLALRPVKTADPQPREPERLELITAGSDGDHPLRVAIGPSEPEGRVPRSQQSDESVAERLAAVLGRGPDRVWEEAVKAAGQLTARLSS